MEFFQKWNKKWLNFITDFCLSKIQSFFHFKVLLNERRKQFQEESTTSTITINIEQVDTPTGKIFSFFFEYLII